ncbi:MAG: Glu-tRNA(Gln) amidotransferase subunit GatD [Nanoarchaeota archaeon]|nr:Glu-tRNA(Gln) amidotransferase subunit GatD [Nanoarchaeota archaeon]MBU1622538.1 Glu-tRNA(Gln) amidotransferase subunit GatD [Nanoarchaeota archaeon]MBU1973770.1 Glu-tRNA(Gln) amidotransferase subunit GatD [Nanoarchaeota archaeon]
MPHPGDRVKIVTKKSTEEGILMPTPDKNTVIIKLDNGYNLGFEKKDVTKIEILEEKKEHEMKKPLHFSSENESNVRFHEPKKEPKEIKKNKALPTIAILHTGGTIASKVDYSTGAVTAKFTAEDTLEMFPELKNIANLETELVSNMMSEDMHFSDYQKIAQAVKKWAEKNVQGIIIGHGTDTLSYTAAALSFIFEKINLPVLLVGSQRSPDRGSSDAGLNLICAAKFIAETDFAGIATCLHQHSDDDNCAIINGTKVRKMHTSRRDAFQPINTTPIALVNLKEIKFLQKDYPKKMDNKVILKDKFETKVGLLKVHPNMDPKLFEFFTKNYQAFVIEGTGLGHAPTNLGKDNLKNYGLLKKFIADGGIVAITSQCLYGAVHTHVYTNLTRLANIGCLFCEDMLPETAFIKLSWLLGNYSSEETKELLTKNLRGEISLHRTFEKEFIDKND